MGIQMCEVGFNGGHSAAALLLGGGNSSKLVSFDLGEHEYSRHGSQLVQRLFGSRHTVRWGDSKISLPQFQLEDQDLKCNVVYVDGEHSYLATVADIRAFAALAACGAMLVIDDIGQAPVEAAIATMLNEHVIINFKRVKGGELGIAKYNNALCS